MHLENAYKAMKLWFRKGIAPARYEQAYNLVHEMLWDRTFTGTERCDYQLLATKLAYIHKHAQYVFSGHTITTDFSAPDSEPFDNCSVLKNSSYHYKCTTSNSRTSPHNTRMGINKSCNGKVFRLDNGASRAFGHQIEEGRKPQLLLIQPNEENTNKEFIVLKYSRDWANENKTFPESMNQSKIRDLLLKEIESL